MKKLLLLAAVAIMAMGCSKGLLPKAEVATKSEAEMAEATKAPRITGVDINVRGKCNVSGGQIVLSDETVPFTSDFKRVAIGKSNDYYGQAVVKFKAPEGYKITRVYGSGGSNVYITGGNYGSQEYTGTAYFTPVYNITIIVGGSTITTLDVDFTLGFDVISNVKPPVIKQVTVSGYMQGGGSGYINIGGKSIPVGGSTQITVPASNKMSISFQSNSGNITNVGGSANISISGGSTGSRSYNGTIDFSRVRDIETVGVYFESR